MSSLLKAFWNHITQAYDKHCNDFSCKGLVIGIWKINFHEFNLYDCKKNNLKNEPHRTGKLIIFKNCTSCRLLKQRKKIDRKKEREKNKKEKKKKRERKKERKKKERKKETERTKKSKRTTK